MVDPVQQPFKIPESVLVVIHTPALEVLLIRRAGDAPDGDAFWQSVTGSKDSLQEDFRATAIREVHEETGIEADAPGCVLRDWWLENVYSIYPQWLCRYAPGVRENTEHIFSLEVPEGTAVQLNPREHVAWQWLPWRQAALACYSSSNAEACLLLPRFADTQPPM